MKILKPVILGTLGVAAVGYALSTFIKTKVRQKTLGPGIDTFSEDDHPKVEHPQRFGDNTNTVGPEV